MKKRISSELPINSKIRIAGEIRVIADRIANEIIISENIVNYPLFSEIFGHVIKKCVLCGEVHRCRCRGPHETIEGICHHCHNGVKPEDRRK